MAEDLMSNETKGFWSYIREMSRKLNLYVQHHVEGVETSVQEDADLEDLWVDYQLRK